VDRGGGATERRADGVPVFGGALRPGGTERTDEEARPGGAGRVEGVERPLDEPGAVTVERPDGAPGLVTERPVVALGVERCGV
jgi:hypothetical protein